MSNQPEHQPDHQPDYNGWITCVQKKNPFSTHHLPCFKRVVEQQYSKCCDAVKNFVDLFDFVEKESGSRQKALQVIVDLLILCQLETYADMLEQYHVPVPARLDPKELTQEARFARLVACVYCNLSSEKERREFSAKICAQYERQNPGPEEEFLDYAVKNCPEKDSANSLLKKTAESFTFKAKSLEIVKNAFCDDGIELSLRKKLTCGVCSCIACILAAPIIAFYSILILYVVHTQNCLPAGYNRTSMAQRNMLSVAATVDSFWYGEVEIQSPQSLSITDTLNCNDLVSRAVFLNNSSAANLRRDQGNEPLQLLWDHGYLAEKSTLNLTITIVVPPTNGAAPALYQLSNWTQYKSLLSSDHPPSTGQDVIRYPINRAGNTTISIPVTSDDFYFFFLYLPATTVFQYQFWLNKYYYDIRDYNLTSSSAKSYHFMFAPSYASSVDMRLRCWLVYQDITSDTYFALNTNVIRNPVILPVLLPVIAVLVVLTIISLCILIWSFRRYLPKCYCRINNA